jgi:hypothetical protein
LNQYCIWVLVFCFFCVTQLSSCSEDTSNADGQKVDGFHFSFDELDSNEGLYSGQVQDYSGNEFHGESVDIFIVPGKIGNAAWFTGAGAAINLKQITGYFPFSDGFTFRAWLKTGNTISGVQQIIGSTANRQSGSDGDGFGIGIVGFGSRTYFELPEDPTYLYSISPDVNIPLDSWFHIAVTYDGENLSYYYNGDLVATDTVLASFNSGFYNHIGSSRNANSNGYPRNQFVDIIDELYVESMVMSSQEIMDYYLDTM